ncbi:hypothetical protein ACWED2_11620 [Amycolatopsis sp. NPDC005003]
MAAFRWLERYTSFCVSVVQSPDAEQVLAAFGGDPRSATRGGPREAQGFHAEEFGFRPVVRVVERDGWAVAVELFSAEGLRRPVLRRLSEVGRAVSFGLGEGGYRLACAGGGEVGNPVPVSLQDGSALRELVERVGVSVDGWPPDDLGQAGVRFVTALSGVVLDDVTLKSVGLVGRVLPVLPEVDVVPLPARSDIDARMAASVARAAGADLRPVVAGHVRDFLVEVEADADELLAAVSRYGDGDDVECGDESGVGLALRELLAEDRLIVGGAPGSAGASRHDVEAIRQRVAAGWATVALLRAGPQAAVGQLMHRRRGADWRARLAADLPEPPGTEAGAAEVQERRARSTPVAAGLFKTRPGESGGRAQATPAGEVRPAPGRFIRPEDGDQL